LRPLKNDIAQGGCSNTVFGVACTSRTKNQRCPSRRINAESSASVLPGSFALQRLSTTRSRSASVCSARGPEARVRERAVVEVHRVLGGDDPQQHAFAFHASLPSRATSPAITNAASGFAHHHPIVALADKLEQRSPVRVLLVSVEEDWATSRHFF
jgi:hypothetical protein